MGLTSQPIPTTDMVKINIRIPNSYMLRDWLTYRSVMISSYYYTAL